MGNKYTKAVIVERGRARAGFLVPSGFDLKEAADQAFARALQIAGLERSEVSAVISTGGGSSEAGFADGEVADIAASARGSVHLFPGVRTVVDIGAEESRVLKVDAGGNLLDFAINDRCAAGAGCFIEAMSRALGVSLDELGELSLQSRGDVTMTAQCAVFAESEIISMIHDQIPREDIARAVHVSMAGRITPVIRRLGLEEEVVAIGGLAKDPGFIRALEGDLGVPITVPAEPEYITALGAALSAAEAGGR